MSSVSVRGIEHHCATVRGAIECGVPSQCGRPAIEGATVMPGNAALDMATAFFVARSRASGHGSVSVMPKAKLIPRFEAALRPLCRLQTRRSDTAGSWIGLCPPPASPPRPVPLVAFPI